MPNLSYLQPMRAMRWCGHIDGFSLHLWEENLPDNKSYLIGQAYHKESGLSFLPTLVMCNDLSGKNYSVRIEENEFHLEEFSTGTYELQIRFAEEEILIPKITIGMRD